VIRNLISCSLDGGNDLLNIGPKPDGSISQESVDTLAEVGRWMQFSGDTIYGSDICQPRRANFASFTRKANNLYMHVHFWPGEDVKIGGLMNKLLGARVLKTGQNISFTQDRFCTKFTGLPMNAPEATYATRISPPGPWPIHYGVPRPVVKTCTFIPAASCSVPHTKSLAGVAAKIRPFRVTRSPGPNTPSILLVPALATEPSAFSTMLNSPPDLFPGVGLALRPDPLLARYSSYQRS